MKMHLVAMGLLLALGTTGAIAETRQHYATASTQKDAKRLATAEARATAKQQATCYHPARQVRECVAVEGGVRCKAETSTDPRACKRAGWVNEYTKLDYAKLLHDYGWTNARPYFTLSDYANRAPTSSTIYGLYLPPDRGPPPPFPSN